jgi:hypothetical protein
LPSTVEQREQFGALATALPDLQALDPAVGAPSRKLPQGTVSALERAEYDLDKMWIKTWVGLAEGLELDLGYILERAGYNLGRRG